MDKFHHFLRQIAPISNEDYEQAFQFVGKLELAKGDYFVKQNKICRQIAFIQSGTLRTFYINEKGEDTTSCFCVENNMTTSYKSFILQQPSHLVLQAIEPTVLLVLNYDNLQKLYASSSVWQNIGRVIAENEYIVMERYASILNNETAKEKYLRLLKEQPQIIQKANVEDIASYLGVTRRTLSRIRQEIAQK